MSRDVNKVPVLQCSPSWPNYCLLKGPLESNACNLFNGIEPAVASTMIQHQQLNMKTLVTLCFMVSLGLVVAKNGRGPCGCRPVFEFCANDYTTYHSICEYKCKHPSTPFQDWYVLYQGPCSGQEIIDQPHKTIKLDKGYEYEPRTGSRYKVHPVPESWFSAEATCRAEGGYLAIINSKTESDVLKELFNKHIPMVTAEANFKYYASIGFKKLSNGQWVTIEGQSLAEAGFEQWSPGEPNRWGGVEHCGTMYKDGLLNDAICDVSLYPFICEAISG